MKDLIKGKYKYESIFKAEKEIAILGKLKHENVIILHEKREKKTVRYMLLDWAHHGDLGNFYSKNKMFFLDHMNTMKLFAQLLKGVEYMHSQNTIHTDLKLANIVVAYREPRTDDSIVPENLVVKIIDFDLAILLPAKGSYRGTETYMAPEVIRKENFQFSEKQDVYSLGVILYALLCGRRKPFEPKVLTKEAKIGLTDLEIQKEEHRLRKEFIDSIVTGDYPMPANLSPVLHGLMNGCLQEKEENRMTLQEVIQMTEIFLKVGADGFVALPKMTHTNKKRMEESDLKYYENLEAKKVEEGERPKAKKGICQKIKDLFASCFGKCIKSTKVNQVVPVRGILGHRRALSQALGNPATPGTPSWGWLVRESLLFLIFNIIFSLGFVFVFRKPKIPAGSLHEKSDPARDTADGSNVQDLSPQLSAPLSN